MNPLIDSYLKEALQYLTWNIFVQIITLEFLFIRYQPYQTFRLLSSHETRWVSELEERMKDSTPRNGEGEAPARDGSRVSRS